MEFLIKGRLDGLNQYTKANRLNRYEGGKCKKRNESQVIWAIRQAKVKNVINGVKHPNLQKASRYPVKIKITWYEPNGKRDVDNVTFAVKFILDALVQEGILENDSRKYVNAISHEVLIDKNDPRILVKIYD